MTVGFLWRPSDRSSASAMTSGSTSCRGLVRRLVAQHAGDRAERHAELRVGGLVDLDRHFVGLAMDVGHHAVDAAGGDDAVVLLHGGRASPAAGPAPAAGDGSAGNRTARRWRRREAGIGRAQGVAAASPAARLPALFGEQRRRAGQPRKYRFHGNLPMPDYRKPVILNSCPVSDKGKW